LCGQRPLSFSWPTSTCWERYWPRRRRRRRHRRLLDWLEVDRKRKIDQSVASVLSDRLIEDMETSMALHSCLWRATEVLASVCIVYTDK